MRRMSQDELVASMALLADGIPTIKAPSRRTLSSWENDATSPTVRDLMLLARALGKPVEWFVADLENDEGPEPTDGGPGADEYAPWDSNPEPADYHPNVIDLRRAA
jgi:transcriptional regulator with XRE-family HTH domain